MSIWPLGGFPNVDNPRPAVSDGKEISKAVNTDLANGVTTEATLAGARISPQARIAKLNSEGLMTFTDFSHPDSVHVSSSRISAGKSVMIALPEHSVSV